MVAEASLASFLKERPSMYPRQVDKRTYKIKETIYNPHGSVEETNTYNCSDYNCIAMKPDAVGI